MFGNRKENDKEKRFEIISEQTVNMAGITVVRDSETGVNYLLAQGVNGFSVIPMLDQNGKTLTT